MDVTPHRILDPRIRIDEEPRYDTYIKQGPAATRWAEVSSNETAANSSQASIAIDVPTVNTGLARAVRYHVAGSLAFTCTVAANTTQAQLNGAAQFALRPFPVAQLMTNATATFNNMTVNAPNINRMLSALQSINNTPQSATSRESTSNFTPDFTSAYNEAIGNQISAFRTNDQSPQGAGNWPGRQRNIGPIRCNLNAQANTATVVVPFDVTENLWFLPGFAYSDDSDMQAFYGLTQLQVALTMANWHRLVCFNLDNTVITAINTLNPTVALTTSAFQYSLLEPSATATIERPIKCVVPATTWQYYEKPADAQVNGRVYSNATGQFTTKVQTGTAISSTFSFPTVPKKVIVWVQPSAAVAQTGAAAATSCFPDICYPITNVNLSVGTRGGYLQSANSQQLWAMSMEAGLTADYQRFSGAIMFGPASTANNTNTVAQQLLFAYAGAPVVIDLSKIGLEEGLLPGVAARLTMQVQVTFQNQSATAVTPVLCCALLYDSFLTISKGLSTFEMVSLTAPEAAGAPLVSASAAAAITAGWSADGGLQGGSFLSFFKNLGSKIRDGVEKATGVIGHVMSEAPKLAGILGPAGVGIAKAAQLGSQLTGGAYESPSTLNARLSNLRRRR